MLKYGGEDFLPLAALGVGGERAAPAQPREAGDNAGQRRGQSAVGIERSGGTSGAGGGGSGGSGGSGEAATNSRAVAGPKRLKAGAPQPL